MRARILTLALLWAAVTGCGRGGGKMTRPIDLSTPEAAMLSLEDAYRAADIEAAVKCKDFRTEAAVMLQKTSPELKADGEVLAKLAEVLELAFRREIKDQGFPDFRGVTSTFNNQTHFQNRADMVQLTETCTHTSGTSTTNQVYLAKSEAGWRMVVVTD